MSMVSKTLCVAISQVKEATTATHTLELNFTMKSWAESLVLMSVIMHGPYLKRTHLLCVIWWYCLWAACPCLSLSTVAMRALTLVIFAPGFFHAGRLHSSFSTCAKLKCTYLFVNGHTQTCKHTHASCIAVSLVWGSLRLAPIILLIIHHSWNTIKHKMQVPILSYCHASICLLLQCNPSIMDTIGHQHFVPYSEVSVNRGFQHISGRHDTV